MLRFGHFFGARPETFYAPSGLGDLILTTTEELSRNKSFGVEIAKGRSLPGRTQAHSGPNFHRLYQVLYENHDPKEIIGALTMLPPKFEEDA